MAEATLGEDKSKSERTIFVYLTVVVLVGAICWESYGIYEELLNIDDLLIVFENTTNSLFRLKLAIFASTASGIAFIATAIFCLCAIKTRSRFLRILGVVTFLMLGLSGLSDWWLNVESRLAFPNEAPDFNFYVDILPSILIAVLWLLYFGFAERIRLLRASSPFKSKNY